MQQETHIYKTTRIKNGLRLTKPQKITQGERIAQFIMYFWASIFPS